MRDRPGSKSGKKVDVLKFMFLSLARYYRYKHRAMLKDCRYRYWASKANSGISGFWVDPQRAATPDCQDGPNGCMPSNFDKAYYDGFFDMGWEKDASGMWRYGSTLLQ